VTYLNKGEKVGIIRRPSWLCIYPRRGGETMTAMIVAPELGAVKGIKVTARKGGREWTFSLPWGNGRREAALRFLEGLKAEGVEEIIVCGPISISERRENYVGQKW
jgi:hypothetical protein